MIVKGKLGRGGKMVTRLTARYDYTTECPARYKQEILHKIYSSTLFDSYSLLLTHERKEMTHFLED